MNENPDPCDPAPEADPPTPDAAPRKRGRPPYAPGMARSSSLVVALRPEEHERARAWAKAQGRPLGDAVRGLLLPLIGALALALAVVGCGAGAGTMAGAASVVASAKPVLDVACYAVERTCSAVEAACGWLDAGVASEGSAGGEAPASEPDAGP